MIIFVAIFYFKITKTLSTMAKGTAMGLWHGKKGSSVFYHIKNSNNAQKQGIRERVYEVSNPRSSKQAGQRMKLLPAQRFANMFSSVIDRAFEGVDYGLKSRQEFMRYALKMDSGFPYVEKNDPRLWPGKYLMSRGTLPRVECIVKQHGSEVSTSLGLDSSFTENTIGSFSRSILAANSYLRAGDQLTFLAVMGVDMGYLIDTIPLTSKISIILDTTSIEEVPQDLFGIIVKDSSVYYEIVGPVDFFLGAAVIISRESSSGGHLRSTSYMACALELDDIIFSTSAMQRARRSYQNSVKTNANWELVPGSGISVDEETEVIEYTIESVNSTTYQAAVGKKVLVLAGVDTGNILGTYYTMFLGAQVLVTPTGQALTIEDSEQAEIGVPASVVPALAGLPSVIYQP